MWLSFALVDVFWCLLAHPSVCYKDAIVGIGESFCVNLTCDAEPLSGVSLCNLRSFCVTARVMFLLLVMTAQRAPSTMLLSSTCGVM